MPPGEARRARPSSPAPSGQRFDRGDTHTHFEPHDFPPGCAVDAPVGGQALDEKQPSAVGRIERNLLEPRWVGAAIMDLDPDEIRAGHDPDPNRSWGVVGSVSD